LKVIKAIIIIMDSFQVVVVKHNIYILLHASSATERLLHFLSGMPYAKVTLTVLHHTVFLWNATHSFFHSLV